MLLRLGGFQGKLPELEDCIHVRVPCLRCLRQTSEIQGTGYRQIPHSYTPILHAAAAAIIIGTEAFISEQAVTCAQR